jgi:hypothetical protein
MKVWRLLPCVTLLALFGAAPNASATIVEVEYTGVVKSGTDGGGLFGPQGADLAQQPFVLDFIFDTTIGVVTRQPTLNVIEGGSDVGSPFDISPNLSAQIEIDGKSSPKIVGSHFSVMQAANGDLSNINQQLHQAFDGVNTLGAGAISHTLSGDIPASIDVPLLYVFSPNDEAFGSVLMGGTRLDLAPTTLRYSIAPEASTWVMMSLGFAVLGCAYTRRSVWRNARRRRHVL